jgi:hypothetical protein
VKYPKWAAQGRVSETQTSETANPLLGGQPWGIGAGVVEKENI